MKFSSHLCCKSSQFHPTSPASYVRFFRAVHLWTGSGLCPGGMTSSCFPSSPSISMWLSSADWLSCWKWKVRALPLRFLYGLRCMCLGLVLKFLFNHHLGSFSLARPGTLVERAAPPWLKVREGYAGVRAYWWGKVWFWSLYSKLVFKIALFVMFVHWLAVNLSLRNVSSCSAYGYVVCIT